MVFVENTEAWRRFETTEELKDLRVSFYLFNVTNPMEASSDKNVKIKVEEVGPFVYDLYRIKDFVSVDKNTGLITYKLRTRYIRNLELSVADSNLLYINWPNVPLLVSAARVNAMNRLKRDLAKTVFNRFIKKNEEQAFITDTVENFLFAGSKRVMFEELQKVAGIFTKDWPLKDNKFALLYDKNLTWTKGLDPELTVSAGIGGQETYSDLNQLRLVNKKPLLTNWEQTPDQCNIPHGTDFQFFSPLIDASSDLTIFPLEVCRKVELEYDSTVPIQGIESLVFSYKTDNFMSYSKIPENECYCLERDKNNKPLRECDLDGLIDISTCIYQKEIVASLPHFYGGSNELRSRIDGISEPTKEKHLPRISIEPNTGLTMRLNTSLQFNVRLRKDTFNNFKFFQDDEPLIIPLTWIRITSQVSDHQSAILRSKLILLDSKLITGVLGGTIVMILAVAIGLIWVSFKYRKAPPPREPIETDSLLAGQHSSVRVDTITTVSPSIVASDE